MVSFLLLRHSLSLIQTAWIGSQVWESLESLEPTNFNVGSSITTFGLTGESYHLDRARIEPRPLYSLDQLSTGLFVASFWCYFVRPLKITMSRRYLVSSIDSWKTFWLTYLQKKICAICYAAVVRIIQFCRHHFRPLQKRQNCCRSIFISLKFTTLAIQTV